MNLFSFNYHQLLRTYVLFNGIIMAGLQKRFLIDVRYTSYLNIGDFRNAKSLDEINSYKQSSVSRRQQIRYSIRDKILTTESNNIGMFIDFDKETLSNQSINLNPDYYDKLFNLIDKLISTKKAKMFLSSTAEGLPGSIAIFGIDALRAHYLYGADSPDLRNDSIGTAVLWNSFYKLSKMNINQVDLEGVNSPKRGWFKLSFGGELIPYYSIKYPNNN